MQYTAKLRYLHITPRKVRRLAELMRGKNAHKARAELMGLIQRPRRPLVKLLDSAAANAREQDGIRSEALTVKTVRVDPAPKVRRPVPRAFGRTNFIEKRMSHVTVVLETSGVSPARLTPPREREAVFGPKKPSAAREPAARERVPKPDVGLTRRSALGRFGRRLFQRKSV